MPITALRPLLALALLAGGGCATQDPPPAPPVAPRPARVEPEPPVEPSAEVGAALARARELERAGEGRGAAAAYLEAGALWTPGRGWAELLAAGALAGTGDTAAVRRRLAEATDPTLAREWGWRHRVQAHRVLGDLRGGAEAAESAARSAEGAAQRVAAWRTAAELRLQFGDSAGARAALSAALGSDPDVTGARAAAAHLARWPGLTADELRRAGETLLRGGSAEEGVRLLERYLAVAPAGDAGRAGVHAAIGRARFAARRYAEALAHLEAAAPAVPESALLLGRARFRMGDTGAARSALAAAARRFPGSGAAAEALFILGEMEQDAGRVEGARARYRESVATGAPTPAALQAALRLAALALVRGEPEVATADLRRYLGGRTRPELVAPARFWAGRAAVAGGDTAAAREHFLAAAAADPFSYYGVLALGRMGRSLRDAPLAPGPVEDSAATRAVDLALARADLLRGLGLEAEAEFELERLLRSATDGPGVHHRMAEEMIRRGRPVAAALMGREIQRERGAWDARLLRIVYQFPFREAVEREAARHGIDPFLMAGLIRQESFFNPLAVSPAGATGLMQVMPATGRSLARRLGLGDLPAARLREPETNLRLGAAFLADQLRRYSTLTEVLAAYNAGPGRVARWRAFPEHADEELFVERIPYAETRDYVRKVRFHAHLYRLLYGAPDEPAAP